MPAAAGDVDAIAGRICLMADDRPRIGEHIVISNAVHRIRLDAAAVPA